MPVTAKLSSEFYDRFGDQAANELVEWMNSVDAAYRQEFRELFEVHFSRFEARLQQGLAELRAEFKADIGDVRKDMGLLEARMQAQFSRLIMWSFGFWIANVVTVLTVLKLADVL